MSNDKRGVYIGVIVFMLVIGLINFELKGLSIIVVNLIAGIVLAILHGRFKDSAPVVEETAAKVVPQYDEGVVQILSMLQRKGRFVDFILEDIGGYSDTQVGSAVRNIHKGCREVFSEYIKIEPVMGSKEGDTVAVEAGYDPSAILVTGNVKGNPPFRGVLRHSGHRVLATTLPGRLFGADISIIQQAEVEIE